MNLKATAFLAILPLLLGACAGGQSGAAPPPTAAPASAAAATVRVGHLDTGFFLYLGNTRIRIVSVDGQGSAGDDNHPLTLEPGTHRLLVTAFRDPVLAYACVTADFAAGKVYVAQSTKPYMETTTIWIEDGATSETVSQKVAAETMRQPVGFSPALNQALFGSPPEKC